MITDCALGIPPDFSRYAWEGFSFAGNPAQAQQIVRARPGRVALIVSNLNSTTSTEMAAQKPVFTAGSIALRFDTATFVLYKDVGPLVGESWWIPGISSGITIRVIEVYIKE